MSDTALGAIEENRAKETSTPPQGSDAVGDSGVTDTPGSGSNTALGLMSDIYKPVPVTDTGNAGTGGATTLPKGFDGSYATNSESQAMQGGDRPKEADFKAELLGSRPVEQMSSAEAVNLDRTTSPVQKVTPGEFEINGKKYEGNWTYDDERKSYTFHTQDKGKSMTFDIGKEPPGTSAAPRDIKLIEENGRPINGRTETVNLRSATESTPLTPPKDAGPKPAGDGGGAAVRPEQGTGKGDLPAGAAKPVEAPVVAPKPGEIPAGPGKPVGTGDSVVAGTSNTGTGRGDTAAPRPDGVKVDSGNTATGEVRRTHEGVPVAKADEAYSAYARLRSLSEQNPNSDEFKAYKAELRERGKTDPEFRTAWDKHEREFDRRYQQETRSGNLTPDGTRITPTDKPADSAGRGRTDTPTDKPAGTGAPADRPAGSGTPGDKPGTGTPGARPAAEASVGGGGSELGGKPRQIDAGTGRGPDGKPIEGRVSDARVPEGGANRGPDGKPIDGRTPDGKPIDGSQRAADGKVPDGGPGRADGSAKPQDGPGGKGDRGGDGTGERGQKGRDQQAEGGDRGAKPGQDAAAKPEKFQTAEAGLKPQEKLPNIDLTRKDVREGVGELIKKVEAGKLDGLDEKQKKVAEAIKQLEPEKLKELKQLLQEGEKARTKPEEAAVAAKIKEILEGGAEKGRKVEFAEAQSNVSRTISERLGDFLKANKDLLSSQPDSEKGKAAMLELGKLVREMNRELGLDPAKGGLQVKDILARNMDGTIRPAEKTVEGKLITGREEASTLLARLTPAQEQALRNQIERLGEKAPTAAESRKLEGTKAEAGAPTMAARPEDALRVRGELAGKADPTATGGRGEPGARAELGGKVEPGARAETGARPELGVRGELAGKSDPVGRADLGGKPEAGGKLEPGSKLEPAGKDMGGRAETAAGRAQDGAVAGPRGDIAGQKDADGKPILPGRGDITEKGFEEDKKGKKPDDKERFEEEEAKRLSDAALAALAIKKAQEDKERAEKEQLAEKEQKKDPERRQKYVVKEKDTLESIAQKMLRDAKLAALILEINRSVIPVKKVDGKQVIDLRPKTVIWLPTTLDIKEFRGRLFAGPATKYEYADQPSARAGGGMTPEDELAAKFGGTADDYRVDSTQKEGAAEEADLKETVETVEDLTEKAIAGAKTRRANVENMLGSLTGRKEEGGRIKYTVRLGDTLKSIAIKHPSLQDVHLWKIIAEVNKLDTATDGKGNPKAVLKRGAVIEIPTQEEVDKFRERESLPVLTIKTSSQKIPTPTQFDIATKPCPSCNRMSTLNADICPGCGYSFAGAPAAQQAGGQKQDAAEDDAAMVVLAAAGLLPADKPSPADADKAPPAVAEISGAAVFGPQDDEEDLTRAIFAAFGEPESRGASAGEAAAQDTLESREINRLIEQLSESARLVRSPENEPADGGERSRLEILTAGGWSPIVAYEIYDDVSLRHEFMLDGRRKTIRIDLPPAAVHELAENDLAKNWQNYCERFLNGLTISD